jgi:hypothetical protein
MTDMSPLSDLKLQYLDEMRPSDALIGYTFQAAETDFAVKAEGFKVLGGEPHIYVSYTNKSAHATGDYFQLYRFEGRAYFYMLVGEESDPDGGKVIVYMDGMIVP